MSCLLGKPTVHVLLSTHGRTYWKVSHANVHHTQCPRYIRMVSIERSHANVKLVCKYRKTMNRLVGVGGSWCWCCCRGLWSASSVNAAINLASNPYRVSQPTLPPFDCTMYLLEPHVIPPYTIERSVSAEKATFLSLSETSVPHSLKCVSLVYETRKR